MLDIIDPNSFILGSISAIVGAKSIRLIIFEFPFIPITVLMPKCALAFRSILHPVPFVFGSIWPHLYAVPVPNSSIVLFILLLFFFLFLLIFFVFCHDFVILLLLDVRSDLAAVDRSISVRQDVDVVELCVGKQ